MYCCFDVLVRMLRHLGYSVTYVRNFTDIDDKIIARAREAGEDPLALASRHGPCPAHSACMCLPEVLLPDNKHKQSQHIHNPSLCRPEKALR